MTVAAPGRPGLTFAATLRLGLFQACLGCLAVIFAGLLNRVMITELAFPGLLVGGSLAVEQLAALARPLFGQISDSRPIVGRHRLPYVWLGTLVFCGLAALSVPLIFRMQQWFLLHPPLSPAGLTGVLLLCLFFGGYGLSVSLATTPYLALVVDRTTEEERPRAVGLIWFMLTVGIVVGAISTAISLRSLDGVSDPEVLEPVLQTFMTRVVIVVLALSFVATWRMEAPASQGLRRSSRGDREDAIGAGVAWTLIRSSPQVFVFFLFLVLFTLGLFLQDPILESYGAEVFGLSISATAALNGLWGGGTLIGLLVAGWWIVPRLGKLPAARLGCRMVVGSLVLLLLAGVVAQPALLWVVMVLFGLSAGLATNSALCLMLDLTLPEVAGTFVGVWGLAQALSRGLGKVIGGGLLSVGHWLHLPEPFGPFALVIGIEALVAIGALLLLSRVNLQQFRQDTGRSLSRVLALEVS
ncbi:MAG: BCD family MFS transporter [Cyanobacteriota bacterium]